MIRRGPANRTVLPVGATAWLPCWVGGGDPPASVGWLKDGGALVGAQAHVNLLENGTLEITGLRVSWPRAEAQGTQSRGGTQLMVGEDTHRVALQGGRGSRGAECLRSQV